jgi:hypothetical protein
MTTDFTPITLALATPEKAAAAAKSPDSAEILNMFMSCSKEDRSL